MTNDPKAPSHGLSVVLAFALTLLAGHGVASFATPGLVRLCERRVPWYAGERLSVGLSPDTRPRVAVIGTSLSGVAAPGQPAKPTLARALGASLRLPPDSVLNLSEAGRNVADLFAELLRARDLGAGSAVVELNPFIFDDRSFRFAGPRPDLVVSTETQRAVEVFPWVRPSVKLAAARQIGAEGWLETLALRFAPYRLHVTRTGSKPSSSVAGGLVLGWIRYGEAGEEEEPDPRRRSRITATICDNFAFKPRRGLDTEVLADMMGWATRSGMQVRFFVPPMNQALITGCGAASRAGLDGIVEEMKEIAEAQGIELLDLSWSEEDAAQEVFVDYGHFHAAQAARAFAATAARLAPLVEVR